METKKAPRPTPKSRPTPQSRPADADVFETPFAFYVFIGALAVAFIGGVGYLIWTMLGG